MKLYLIRHAIAEEQKNGQTDEERALTPEGITKFRLAARGLVRLVQEDGLPMIWTSPLVRARQTAALLTEALGEAKMRTDLRVSPNLAPPGHLPRFLKEIRAKGAQSVAAVGHESILSDWVGTMCFGTEGLLMLKKGGVAVVELEESGMRAELMAVLQPAVLRRIQ